MSARRTEVLSEIKQLKDSLAASEKRGRRAVRKLRDIEKVLEAALPKMRTWVSLPVDEASIARCLTTGQVRELVRLIDGEGATETTPPEVA